MNSLVQSAVQGGLRFGLASLAVFATVAFGERWMYQTLGLWGAYAVWTVLFMGLGGGALLPLAPKHWRGARFFGLFALAFFLYALAWTAVYFLSKGTRTGEWIASLGGSCIMVRTFVVGARYERPSAPLALLFFALHSLGYFVGSALNDAFARPTGMLLWGGVYGVCLGAGLGVCLKEIGGNQQCPTRSADELIAKDVPLPTDVGHTP